ncbi:MAG: class I SAM-dependent rRNA methyltransferase [Deltaproteobacteria bacterium]|nr:class I SAM-dependent rRNA methyltransferase [Deltaproteobacteria bacterium]
MKPVDRSVPAVRLAPGKDQRLKDGHLWIRPNDIQEEVGKPESGGVVDVLDFRGRFLARGHYNEASKLRVRLLTYEREPVDEALFRTRIARALEMRQRVLEDVGLCRVVYGESDLLPGLVVDRLGDVAVMQTMSLGMDRQKKVLAELLAELLGVKAVYERNDGAVRRLEGMEESTGPLVGAVPEPFVVTWGGLSFPVDVVSGQKTGIFLDQRENHLAVRRLAKGRRVLDAFCYGGGFGLQAAAGGAAHVVGIDASALAVELARKAAEANGLTGRTEWQEGNVFDVLRTIEPGSFDLVVLDPPAFARNRKALPGAYRGYKEINLRAMKLLPPGGILVTCSCSYHMTRDLFGQMLVEAARDARRSVRVLEERGAPADHPVLLGHPETAYLKCVVAEVY